jgi:hypothetical protein
MTRYINLCRDAIKRTDDKPITEKTPEPTKYEKYKESYEEYRNLDHRKEFQHRYNKTYRLKHSFMIECECGVTHKDISRYAHIKSQRHISYYQKQNTANS